MIDWENVIKIRRTGGNPGDFRKKLGGLKSLNVDKNLIYKFSNKLIGG